MKHAIEFFFFSLFRGFLHILPFSLVQRTGKVLGYAAFTVLSRRRSITLENLRYAFPEKSGSELNRIARLESVRSRPHDARELVPKVPKGSVQ